MKTAVLGGTFDPVHNGHLHLLALAITEKIAKRIFIIPTHLPPHKAYEAQVSDNDRLAMLQLALEEFRVRYPEAAEVKLIVEECELQRQGPSYMYDTIKHLQQQYQITERIALVIGTDLAPDLDQWHRYRELSEMVDFYVFNRGQELSTDIQSKYQLKIFDNHVLEVSSTAIRSALAIGEIEKVSSLLPQSVVHYIQDHGLYGT